MTYRNEQTLMTPYPDNVILWRIEKNKHYWRCIPTTLYYDVSEKTNINDAVSRQRCTMTYRKEQTLMALYPDNVVLDVPERTNANGVVSQQRYTMTYRKEQTLMTLYPDNVIPWRTVKNKR